MRLAAKKRSEQSRSAAVRSFLLNASLRVLFSLKCTYLSVLVERVEAWSLRAAA